MNKYIVLLQESARMLKGMFEFAQQDQSIADYINEIQVAYNFVQRALKTQEPNDVYRALQKTHEILTSESDDETEEAYADFAEKIREAIEDLGESGYIKESQLKSLTKAILKEIYMEPEPEHPLAQLFSKLSKAVQGSNPAFVDISKGHEMAHRIVAAIIADIKSMVKSSASNNKDEFSKGVQAFEAHSSSLMNFIIGWAQQIHAEHPETDEQLDRVMHEFKDHLTQIGAQFKEVFINLRQKNDFKKPNVINAMKQLEHLNEIFKGLKESIDALFQIGLSSGYGKKK